MSITKTPIIKAQNALLALLLTTALATPGRSATVIYQEGSDGYSGTTDSYIGSGGYYALKKQNFGTAPTMLVGFEHYQGG
jgi:hypothetical protein